MKKNLSLIIVLGSKKTGSALVFSLIILSFILVVALGMASVAVKEYNMSQTTKKSTQSFQVADSGAEMVLNKIYTDATLSDINSLAASIDGGSCSDGVFTATTANGDDYAVSFYDGQEPPEELDCTDSIFDIERIKSSGSHQVTTRAIELSVGDIESGKVGWWNFDSATGLEDIVAGNDAEECDSTNYTSSSIPPPPVPSGSPTIESEGDIEFIQFNDGSTNCAVIPHDDDYFLPNGGTISFWMRYRVDPFANNSVKSILVKDANMCDIRTDPGDVSDDPPDTDCDNKIGGDDDCDCGHLGFRFNLPNVDEFGVRYQNDGNGYHYGLTADNNTTSFWENEWRHIVFTFNSNKYAFYIDGLLQGSYFLKSDSDEADGILEGLKQNDWNLYLGGYGPGYPVGGAGLWSQVDMDDLRIYERSFSSFEVRKLYNQNKDDYQ